MLRFNAQHFLGISHTLGQLSFSLRSGKPADGNLMHLLKGQCGELRRLCDELALSMSAVHVSRLSQVLESRSNAELLAWIDQVTERVWDELSQRVYLQVPVGLSKYYEPSEPPFGQKVFDQFPSAIADVAGASNCIAVEQDTAAVFHLMRVMEVGLKVLAAELGIPYAPSWESYLRQMKTNVESDWNSKPPDVRAKQPFYKDVMGDLQCIKIAWRNPTMHIVKSYTPDESFKIFSAVSHFMQRLADAGLAE